MKEIQEHKIKIYEFPETDDEEENKLVKKIKVKNYVVYYLSAGRALTRVQLQTVLYFLIHFGESSCVKG